MITPIKTYWQWVKPHEGNYPNPYDYKKVMVKYHNNIVEEIDPYNTGWHPLFNVASVKWRPL